MQRGLHKVRSDVDPYKPPNTYILEKVVNQ